MLKRLFDFIAASIGLVLLAPLLAAVALAVRRSSSGPVIFRQVRVGRAGADFVLCKFRTMRAPVAPVDGATFEAGSTARVTPIGRVLRKWKLDELPQLWNVVKGDMALVGPRPEVRQWVQAYPERWSRVLRVRPGITDPASIEFRDEEEVLAAAPDPADYYRRVVLPRKLDLYERYVDTHTFSGDIRILFKTLRAVFR